MEWPQCELTDADRPGVAYLGLPVDGQQARALLRGQPPPQTLVAHITQAGRFADMHALGWPGLYALSPRLASIVGKFAGTVLWPLRVETGPNGYALLGVTGRCGAADYSKSLQVGRIGNFVRLRGLHVGVMDGPVDFAIPPNLETILVTAVAGDTLEKAKLENVRLRSLKDQEFDVPEEEVSAQSDG